MRSFNPVRQWDRNCLLPVASRSLCSRPSDELNEAMYVLLHVCYSSSIPNLYVFWSDTIALASFERRLLKCDFTYSMAQHSGRNNTTLCYLLATFHQINDTSVRMLIQIVIMYVAEPLNYHVTRRKHENTGDQTWHRCHCFAIPPLRFC
jgi:hypothetical protein